MRDPIFQKWLRYHLKALFCIISYGILLGFKIYLPGFQPLSCDTYAFMEESSTDPFAMQKRNNPTYLSYTGTLVMVFPEYPKASGNSSGIIPAKYMNCILIIVIQILICTILFDNKDL